MKNNSVKIEFIFGLEKNSLNQEISWEKSRAALKEIKRVALELFGGYSYSQGRGAWVNDGETYSEECGNVTIVQPQTATADGDRELRAAIETLASVIKNTLALKAVLINVTVINSELF